MKNYKVILRDRFGDFTWTPHFSTDKIMLKEFTTRWPHGVHIIDFTSEYK